MENLKTLKTFNSRIEADIAKSYLKSNNIKSFIVADDAGSMYPSQDFVSGVKLLVNKKDYMQAKKLLSSIKKI
ncbi:MAG: DUF2007 domain-containing protein [Actinobacteria bacterium]|nr:DUF2007 domain-containing protein [Actinomycetota bacterium]MBM3713064.1 DUF2007 domain-containing protein [Actinomycetota bacterium]